MPGYEAARFNPPASAWIQAMLAKPSNRRMNSTVTRRQASDDG